jgi:hypothetical protein
MKSFYPVPAKPSVSLAHFAVRRQDVFTFPGLKLTAYQGQKPCLCRACKILQIGLCFDYAFVWENLMQSEGEHVFPYEALTLSAVKDGFVGSNPRYSIGK